MGPPDGGTDRVASACCGGTRGHGGSDVPPGPYDFADFTGDVLGLMDHFGIEKARFMGVSLGGMTGMGLAIPWRAP